MQNDERDNRDHPPDEPPDQPQSDQPTTDEPPVVEPPVVEPPVDEADEFETASWPSQDTAVDRSAADSTDDAAGETPEAQPAEEAEQAEASEQAEPFRAVDTRLEPGPPPPEVEAYGAATAGEAPAMAAHSVPATEPGESTQCPRCGTENRPGIAFCSNCGQRLVAAGAPTTVARPAAPEGTQACPRCGTHNRAGVAFCQNCGANLRPAEPGYVPPGVAPPVAAAAAAEDESAGHALLGPIVLLVGAVGIATAWLLPFATGTSSLFDRAFGDPTGYGIGFWTAYEGISGLASQAYFGFAAPAPILVLLLLALAIVGVIRARPGGLQMIGLVVALVWAVGLLALFVVVEVLGGPGTDILGVLAGLSPGGIIFALASLIVMIGAFTRLGRG
jgi:Double zinc ribbon